MHRLQVKRVYEPASHDDGERILVDRLWPRGLTKDKAQVDLWFKQLAPSAELRRWFGHDPNKWDEFMSRYFAELNAAPQALAELKRHLAARPVTLLYGAKDEAHNQAVALMAFVQQHQSADRQD